MKKKINGFTLVELLAVIVILAVILIIAVPQILNTIESARLGAFRNTAKLLVSQAEKQYLVDKALDSQMDTKTYDLDGCKTLAKLTNDYSGCEISVTASGVASLNLTGAGKFSGYTCTNATKDNIDTTGCVKSDSGDSSNNQISVQTLYAYAPYIEEDGWGYYDGNPVQYVVSTYSISDFDSCKNGFEQYFAARNETGWTEENIEGWCRGEYHGFSIESDINGGLIYELVKYGIVDNVSLTLGDSKEDYRELNKHAFFKYKTDFSELYACTDYNIENLDEPMCFEFDNYSKVSNEFLELFGEACTVTMDEETGKGSTECQVKVSADSNLYWIFSISNDWGDRIEITYPEYYDSNDVQHYAESAIINNGMSYTYQN